MKGFEYIDYNISCLKRLIRKLLTRSGLVFKALGYKPEGRGFETQ
jgi:hypothetical protein